MATMLRRGSRAAASRALALGRAESYHSVAAWRVGGPTALLRGVQPGEDGGFGGKGPVSDHWGGVRGRGVGAFAGIDKPFALGGAQTRALHAATPSQGKRDGSVSPTVLEDLLKVPTRSHPRTLGRPIDRQIQSQSQIPRTFIHLNRTYSPPHIDRTRRRWGSRRTSTTS